MVGNRLRRGYRALEAATSRGFMLFVLFIVVLLALDVISPYYDKYTSYHDEYTFNHLSPSEHLRIARENSTIPSIAIPHLEHIPPTAPEYREATELLATIRANEKADQEALQREQSDPANIRAEQQAKRDDDARFDSYWPTTLRVDTDMDSFWLRDEERTCQTYPDEKGRVAVVACNATGSHRDHNIPVKFWGGVERNTVSDWRCRREGDDFVCRAID